MREKLWTRSYIMTLIVMFGVFISAGIMMSVLGIHARNMTGLDTYVGMMITMYTIGAFSVRFLAGGLVDKFGAKLVILAGVAILSLGSVWLIFAENITQVLLARVLQGAGFGLASTAVTTLIAILSHPTRLFDAIGYAAVVQSLSSVIGPPIGFALIGQDYSRFTLLFSVSDIVGGVTFLLVMFTKQGQSTRAEKEIAEDGDGQIRWSWLSLPIIVLFMNSLSQSSILSFLPLYAIDKGFGGVGSFFSINALGMIASRFIMGSLVERYKKFPLIFINTAVYAVTIFLLTQATDVLQLLILAFPAGFAMGSVAPFINTYLLEIMPSNKKGLTNAIYFSTLDSGYGLGSVVWGVVAMSVGYTRTFHFAALLQVVAVLLTLGQIKLLRKNRSNFL